MIGLNNKGMERLAKIQGKYKFMNHFELESDDVYEFCSNIIAASRLGLCLEDDDESFIQMVLDNISVWNCRKRKGFVENMSEWISVQDRLPTQSDHNKENDYEDFKR